MIGRDEFKEKYRTASKYFSRDRILTFPIMMLLLIQKSAKSMQVVLNEFCDKLKMPLVTSSAFSQARRHLKPTAFIELNQKTIVAVCYDDGEYARYKGHRLLGVDGSKVHLPPEAEIVAEFGGTVKNQHRTQIEPFGLVSVLYDVLNEIALDGVLAPGKSYEVDLARDHLAHTQPGDLLVFDRNYPSYVWLATLSQHDVEFVGRCSKTSFKAVRRMFAGHGPDSQIVTLKVPANQKKVVTQLGLPEKITVRLVRLTLASGEVEVLITSLLDAELYPTAEFGEVYFLRWGVETFFDRLKNRLQLENFTGRTVEAVNQDFYATLYISGLESLLIEPANSQLRLKEADNHYPQQVNHAVAFNAIKNHVIDLFFTETDEAVLLDKLTALFLTKPTCVRKGRSVPRPKFSAYRSLQFHKRFKKICF